MASEYPVRIPLHAVRSSNLSAIGFDDDRLILAVQFRSGAIFHYAGVSADLALDLLRAESIGGFYAQNIKGKFQGEKMTGHCPKCAGANVVAIGWIGDKCVHCGKASYQPDPPKEEANGDDTTPTRSTGASGRDAHPSPERTPRSDRGRTANRGGSRGRTRADGKPRR